MSKLLTVFGATGQQGGSLISYILQHPQLSKLYHLRGITRDASKASALSLKAHGVEVIEADLNDLTSLIPAIAASYAVFGVTNFWDQASAKVEIAQGLAIADACIAANVKLLIWSSLPNVTKMTSGKLTSVKHFDSKAYVEEYIRKLPIMSAFFRAGWYMQNHLSYMPPIVIEDGNIVFSQTQSPNAKVPMIDIRDTGKFIAPILLNPEKYNGKYFTCATAFYTPLQLAEGWSKVTGKKVTYQQVDPGEGRDNLTEEMRKELKGSLGLIDEFSYFGPTGQKDLEWTLAQMEEDPRSWEDFVRDHEPWFSEG